jgi:hypothetical protein
MKIGLSQEEEQARGDATNQVDTPLNASVHQKKALLRRKLAELFEGTQMTVPSVASKLEIRQVSCDSRKVQPGALFFALHGAKADGNAFIKTRCSGGDCDCQRSASTRQATRNGGLVQVQGEASRWRLPPRISLVAPPDALQLSRDRHEWQEPRRRLRDRRGRESFLERRRVCGTSPITHASRRLPRAEHYA